MVDYKEEELNRLKYRELQKIAKDLGIKANAPKFAIIDSILGCSKSVVAPSSEDDDGGVVVLNETFDVEKETNVNSQQINPGALDSCASDKTFDVEEDEKEMKKKPSRFLEYVKQRKLETERKIKEEESANKNLLSSPRRQNMVVTAERSIIKFSPAETKEKKGELPINSGRRTFTTIKRLSSKIPCKVKEGKKSRNEEISPILKRDAKGGPAINGSTPGVCYKTSQTPGCKRPRASSSPLSSKKPRFESEVKEDDEKSIKSTTFVTKRTRMKIPRRIKVPDFAKLHAQEFKKMDSLDTYLSKKQERIKAIQTPKTGTKIRRSPRLLQQQQKTPSIVNSLLKKGIPSSERKKKPFVPSTITVQPSNFNFRKDDQSATKATQQHQQQTGEVFHFKATPKDKVLNNITNSSVTKCGGSGKKPTFDLKESLSRKLNYKPYKGKLKNWEDHVKEKFKTRPQPVKKSDKIEILKGVRLNKRAELLLKRRGVN